jgi:hypothetical protein
MRLNIPRVTGKRIRHHLVAPAIVTIHFRIRFVRAEGGRASAITQFLNFAHLLCAQLEVDGFLPPLVLQFWHWTRREKT